MILADKIINMRKKAGWSQEELASRLGVTRQSVSKWEGAQSVPDIEKIVQISRLFSVTTDYLLKDELEEPEPVAMTDAVRQADLEMAYRQVTMEDASTYMKLEKENAPKKALATFLWVSSPIALILLSSISEYAIFGITENVAAAIGLCVLILFVTIGVAIYTSCSDKEKEYAFLEKEPIETEYGVSGLVRERKKEFQPVYTKNKIIGTVLCIFSVMPLFVAMGLDAGDIVYCAAVCFMLFVIAIACLLFVYAGTINDSMQKLLEEEEYTRENKKRSVFFSAVSTCYWLLVTAVFLFACFGPYGNAQPRYYWVIWAIAGVLYGAVTAVLKVIRRQ
ncbi:helix-turn-helix transcriptional regulator [Kineothrix sp. MSJ-39]|nr:helix-turn-helix transcriptional regulator [Kineothrix sp. MSJ-39]